MESEVSRVYPGTGTSVLSCMSLLREYTVESEFAAQKTVSDPSAGFVAFMTSTSGVDKVRKHTVRWVVVDVSTGAGRTSTRYTAYVV